MAKSKSLIIVESPAKIKTLQKFLGSEYIFESSIGHIRDLPQKEFGIDIENDFEPKYVTMPDKEKVIANLRRAAKGCDTVILSPDPDREGEAIAWHIAQILPKDIPIKRVSFNSITKDAVVKALQEPGEINMSLVNAQQARRLLDRLVGYSISPILNRRIQRGKEGSVSAGRVQSVALKLVVVREKEILAFIPVEYWNLAALLSTENKGRPFQAGLYSVDGLRVEKEAVEGKQVMLIGNETIAAEIKQRMQKEPYVVATVERKEKKRHPVPPFITSTLQQEASRHHGFSAARTMGVAQKLYEGVDLGGGGPEGLITYMRTDSVRIAPEAIHEARSFISANFGKEYLPEQPKKYSTKSSAQDAHEAIRPASLRFSPEEIEKYLTREQFLLYRLIWRRFIASQMNPAIYDTVVADIHADGKTIVVRATGSIIKFPGFLAIYEEKRDEEKERKEREEEEPDEESKMLPELAMGQQLVLLEVKADQAFTRPPPRYSEASLVKELEKSGIGRPSTYASIMNKIQSRDYTVKEAGKLKPTELGIVIAELLEANFKQVMDIGFTAEMEDQLEDVAAKKEEWKVLIRKFWEQFSPLLAIAEKEAFVPKQLTEIDCPTCGAKLQKIWFKNKYFYGCSRYPDCTFSAPIEELSFNRDDYAEGFDWEQLCPRCGMAMKVRHGKFGSFLGCTNYPNCKGIVNIPKKGEELVAEEEGVDCPAVGCPGKLKRRKSRFGKLFYSCSTYPDCDVIVNDLNQLAVKYANHPRTAYIPKEKKGGKAASKPAKGDKESKKSTATAKSSKGTKKEVKSGKEKSAKPSPFQTPLKLSAPLAALVGSQEAARTDVTKKVWEYIKAKELQDKQDKRMIVPDETLGEILGSKEPISMFQLTAQLSRHMTK